MLIRKWILCVIFFCSELFHFLSSMEEKRRNVCWGSLCLYNGAFGKRNRWEIISRMHPIPKWVFFVAFAGRSTLSKYNIFNQYQEITRAWMTKRNKHFECKQTTKKADQSGNYDAQSFMGSVASIKYCAQLCSLMIVHIWVIPLWIIFYRHVEIVTNLDCTHKEKQVRFLSLWVV